MKLESKKRQEIKGDYNATVLEQWKTCVDMANSNTEKRNTANNVYITINAAILALVTFKLDYKNLLLSTVGILICVLWIKSIQSYRKLSKVKYEIVNEIEKKLPLKPFTCEWEELKKSGYIDLTKIEFVLPKAFIVLFAFSINSL